MVLFGSRQVNEEDDSGHSHSDPDYPMNEGEEGGERGMIMKLIVGILIVTQTTQ
jgi:hypothetical protein